MAGYINKAILLGNVGKDPEIRLTNDGRRIATFSLATAEQRKDRNSGEKKERTTWHNVVVFNEHLVPIVEQYVKKGSKLYLEGALQTRKWQDQQGQDRYTTEVVLSQYRGEIVLLGDSQRNGPPPAAGPEDYGRERSYGERHANLDRPGRDLDDEIPF